MTAWDELRVILTRLRDEQPDDLLVFPDLRYQESQPPPYQITLVPTAVAVAEDLHSRFGDSADLKIATNGHLTTAVVDPVTGEVIGGFAGAQIAPLITFQVPPGLTERIPMLTGTASFTPRLGYAVPPGSWGIQATLILGENPRDSPRRHTPALPLTVTA